MSSVKAKQRPAPGAWTASLAANGVNGTHGAANGANGTNGTAAFAGAGPGMGALVGSNRRVLMTGALVLVLLAMLYLELQMCFGVLCTPSAVEGGVSETSSVGASSDSDSDSDSDSGGDRDVSSGVVDSDDSEPSYSQESDGDAVEEQAQAKSDSNSNSNSAGSTNTNGAKQATTFTEQAHRDNAKDEGGTVLDVPGAPIVARHINYTWPKRLEDYAPFTKDTDSWKVFFDRGKTLLNPIAGYVEENPPTPDPAMFESGLHVISTFFHGKYHKRRFSEIVATLLANLENPYVRAVHLLWEKENPAQYVTSPALRKKLVLTQVQGQPTYARLFNYTNNVLQRGTIAVITNADIYFDSSLRCLRSVTPDNQHWNSTKRLVLALSRRHTTLCGGKTDLNSHWDLCKEYIHSHDAFVFAPPVSRRVLMRTRHPQNRYGAENIVIWELMKAGGVLRNVRSSLFSFCVLSMPHILHHTTTRAPPPYSRAKSCTRFTATVPQRGTIP